jgi:hypothetical protein
MHVPDPAPRFARQDAPETAAFVMQDGQRVHSLAQLVETLQRASPGVAWYHRDHFVPWLREVLRDEPLARRFEHFARMGGDPEVLRETLLALARARLAELSS